MLQYLVTNLTGMLTDRVPYSAEATLKNMRRLCSSWAVTLNCSKCCTSPSSMRRPSLAFSAPARNRVGKRVCSSASMYPITWAALSSSLPDSQSNTHPYRGEMCPAARFASSAVRKPACKASAMRFKAKSFFRTVAGYRARSVWGEEHP